MVLKICKITGGSTVKDNLDTHRALLALQLPTLALLEQVIFDNKPALIGEYLNNDKLLFVSPNSVITIEQQIASQLNSMHSKSVIESFAEQYLYEHKLTELLNLESFLSQVVHDLHIASTGKLEIYFDSYFFGISSINGQSEIQYKIGDFDQIFHKHNLNFKELFNYNIGEFKSTIYSFIRYFLKEEKQDIYLDIVKQTLNRALV